MSPPDLVMVKDQLVSGNETSPGCFSTDTGGEVSAGRVVPVPVLLFLFLTPTGRPRFFFDEELVSGICFAGGLFDNIIFELKLSVIMHELKVQQVKQHY
jgi:hypothetical protein